jgi:hypothetical protein
MSVPIKIQAGGVFDPAEAIASALVFWRNEDSQPHAPFGLEVAAGGTSNAIQPDSTTAQPMGLPLPKSVSYKCTLHGEIGTIALYNDFRVLVTNPSAGTSPANPVVVVSGGKSPYTMAAFDVVVNGQPGAVQLAEIAGPNAGISATILNPPAGTFTVTFNLNAADQLGNNLDQAPVTITVP